MTKSDSLKMVNCLRHFAANPPYIFLTFDFGGALNII